MATVRNIMSIHDDQFGEGNDLAFPTMSTCSAVICVLGNTLFGIHKTQGAPRPGLFAYAQNALNGRQVHALYVAGWNAGRAAFHDITAIRNALGIGAPPTYVYDYHNTWEFLPRRQWRGRRPRTQMAFSAGTFVKKTTDLCTFATFTANNTAPEIGIKRSLKVHVQAVAGFFQGLVPVHGANARYVAGPETITTPSDHLHRIMCVRH